MGLHTVQACIAGRLVEAPLDLDYVEELLGFFDGATLACLRAVSVTEDCCAILVVRPTEVSHQFHND